jgi:hypothetical protein
VVDDISHEGLRVLLREEGVSFQAPKTFKASNDPDFEAKKNRILQLYAIADGTIEPGPGDPTVVICVDEFGPLNLQPHPGKQWAAVGGTHKDADRLPRRRRRATYRRPYGVRHLFAAYDLGRDKLYGHIKPRKGRTESLAFVRYLRTLYPARRADRDRARQLLPAPVNQERHPRRGLGGQQQHRVGLHAVLRVMAEPHRATRGRFSAAVLIEGGRLMSMM